MAKRNMQWTKNILKENTYTQMGLKVGAVKPI